MDNKRALRALREYLEYNDREEIDAGALSFISGLAEIEKTSPEVAQAIISELYDQRKNLKLIASENYSSPGTQCAMGNLFTDKYAEGIPEKRFYAGCKNVDRIESWGAELACNLFGADHAYMQPHSGSDANLIAFWAVLSAKVQAPFLQRSGLPSIKKLDPEEWKELRTALGNQRLLAMDYSAGGHLTHGYRQNISSRFFDVHLYGVNTETGMIDYEELQQQALEVKPLILLAGYSAYPRNINFRRMREIADSTGAVLMVDMAHFAGLVAGKEFNGDVDPVPFADIVTSTTHKTLRGPRGGLILCTREYAEFVNKGCPMVMGGPLPHVMAAKAVALREAHKPDFRSYARDVVENAKTLSSALQDRGAKVLTGGTDNHLLLLDTRPYGITGRQGENILRDCRITCNRNAVPEDPNGPWYTSGLRLGTPAVTTLGMGKEEMEEIAEVIHASLEAGQPDKISTTNEIAGKGIEKLSKSAYTFPEELKKENRLRVETLLAEFPLYPGIPMELFEEKTLSQLIPQLT